MDFLGTIWGTALAIIASVGGAGVIIIFVGKWLAKLSADALMKKMESEFNEKLEKLKSGLEKRNYISKARFDLEIEVYRQLSEAAFLMAIDLDNLFQEFERIYLDKESKRKMKKDNYSKATVSFDRANQAIIQNAPFIPRNTHELFLDVRDECMEQINFFLSHHLEEDSEEYRRDLEEQYLECSNRAKTISDKMDLLIDKLREHIDKLDVLEK